MPTAPTSTSATHPPARRPLRYAGYDESLGAANIVVDGAPNDSTVLVLSHWPGIPQPPGLTGDLSAQMVFAYLDDPPQHEPVEVVTNNHFDQDGLVGVHALVEPEASLRHRALLVDVAAAGDFGTFRHRDAARASMAIAAWADPERSPIAEDLQGLAYPEQCRVLYERTLPLLVPMAADPERFRHLWAEEDERLTASEQALARGEVTIVEHPEVDLAVVDVTAASPSLGGHRFVGEQVEEIHPFAVNNATDRFRLLIVDTSRGRYRYLDRYETWVQYRTRPALRRVDMAPLAERLDARDPGPVRWQADPASAIMPSMAVDAGSALSPAEVVPELLHHLHSAPVAWDPFT